MDGLGEKSPVFAAVLSFILAGIGQLYLKEYKKATSYLALELATALSAIFVHESLGSVLNLLVSLWAAYDAYTVANERRKKIVKEPKKTETEISVF